MNPFVILLFLHNTEVKASLRLEIIYETDCNIMNIIRVFVSRGCFVETDTNSTSIWFVGRCLLPTVRTPSYYVTTNVSTL